MIDVLITVHVGGRGRRGPEPYIHIVYTQNIIQKNCSNTVKLSTLLKKTVRKCFKTSVCKAR